MTGGTDEQGGDATVSDTLRRRNGDPGGEPFVRALAAVANIPSSGDLQCAGSALAREMCRLATADECSVQLLRAGDTVLLSRYRAPHETDDQAGFRHAVASRVVSLPLVHDEAPLGCVDLCWQAGRPDAGVVTRELLALRDLAAAHLKASLDRDDQQRRLRALDDLATDLRRQVHEYANRMQVLSGLHELGDNVAAQRFLAEMVGGYEGSLAVRVSQIQDPVVAGTLVALMRSAERRNILLVLEPGSRLRRLPSTLNVLDLVTVVGNCVTNALEAAAAQSGERRRVQLKIAAYDDLLELSVRDWGPGVQGRTLDDLCRLGSSTKQGHHGMGLALVREIVENQGGTLDLESEPDGVRLLIALPWN
jgi:anti-sigma regulatory factor (Ser/Thr protein kinase)